MADPLTWATVAKVGSGLATAGSMYMSVQGARSQAKGYGHASDFNTAIRERNKKAAEIQADYSRLIAGTKVVDFRERFRRDVEGATTVAFAKSGVQGTTGTARLVMEENAREADLEIAAIKMQGESDAQAWHEKGVNEGMAADLERIYARNMRTSTRYQQAGAVVSGASKFGSLLADA